MHDDGPCDGGSHIKSCSTYPQRDEWTMVEDWTDERQKHKNLFCWLKIFFILSTERSLKKEDFLWTI